MNRILFDKTVTSQPGTFPFVTLPDPHIETVPQRGGYHSVVCLPGPAVWNDATIIPPSFQSSKPSICLSLPLTFFDCILSLLSLPSLSPIPIPSLLSLSLPPPSLPSSLPPFLLPPSLPPPCLPPSNPSLPPSLRQAPRRPSLPIQRGSQSFQVSLSHHKP